MFIEKKVQKNGKPHRGGMKFLIDDCLTQVGSAKEWNGGEEFGIWNLEFIFTL
ncbi:MAG: hypothetical protein K8R79_03540 [Calditrichales bacterium]|nr:hypothetical protein [Calditrichales bacterium]